MVEASAYLVPSRNMNAIAVSNDAAQAERRWAMEQAQASSRISGHIPTPEFLADCEAFISGTMTTEEIRSASRKRAIAADLMATRGVKNL